MKFLGKRALIPMAAVAVVAAAVTGVAAVKADTSGSGQPESLVQKIADTFHLDKAKVQAVFDQNRTDMQAQAETRYEERLNQAVTSGQLTSKQKDAVLAEHNKLKAGLDSAMSQSGTDRRAAMETLRTEATTWAKDNSIDAKWLMGFGPGHFRGMGPGMHHDGDGDDAGAPAESSSPSASPSSS